MVGAIPKFLIADRASRATSPAMPRRALPFPLPFPLPLRWHWVALAALCLPLSFVLVQCGKAPNADMLAANTEGAKSRAAKSRTSIDTFDDRFPQPQFADRFPTANESLPQVQRQVALAPQPRTVRTEPVRVASLTPTPTMSATTMATATRTETLEPLPVSEPGHAGLPVSDAAISDHTFSAAARSCIVQADAPQFKQC